MTTPFFPLGNPNGGGSRRPRSHDPGYRKREQERKEQAETCQHCGTREQTGRTCEKCGAPMKAENR